MESDTTTKPQEASLHIQMRSQISYAQDWLVKAKTQITETGHGKIIENAMVKHQLKEVLTTMKQMSKMLATFDEKE